MAKELPYFRFTIQEWQNGDISTMPDSCKGVFIDICPFYWAHNCEVTEDTLFKKFKTKGKLIQKLIKSGVIKCQNGVVSISFLDQQLSELNQKKSFFSDMGKLGQKVKKTKAPLKTDLSYKDKDKDKENYTVNDFSFLGDERFAGLWNDYLKSRKTKLNIIGQKASLKKLHKYTIDISCKALEKSIESGYTGLFPESITEPKKQVSFMT